MSLRLPKSVDDFRTCKVYEFHEDIANVLSYIISYSEEGKEIFLRDMISMCSRALDEIAYQSLIDSSEVGELCIKLIPNKKDRTLTIIDTGIGMTKVDLLNNLGTLSKPSTKYLARILEAGADISSIGPCGSGFYSSYLVADKVTVASKRNGNEQYIWEYSVVQKKFTVRLDEGKQLGRGTKFVLYLKENATDFLEEKIIRDVVQKHSQFIIYPIKLVSSYTAVREYCKILNDAMPIWMRIDEISKEEYAQFYKSLTNDWADYLAVKHFSVEGEFKFRALLFVPGRLPWRFSEDSIKLYVKNVFVMDRCEILPTYLNFIKGVVGCEDFPVNISRGTTEYHAALKAMKKNLTKKCIEFIEEISKDTELYRKFYELFRASIKFGICEDSKNVKILENFLRYYTSASGNDYSPLKDYVTRMKMNQEYIYFITGESRHELKNSAIVRMVKNRGYEVLYMTDPIDKCCIERLRQYDGKKLVCVTKQGLMLPEDEVNRVKYEADKARFEGLCAVMKDILAMKVEEVVVSNRLMDSPCCIVTARYGFATNMERITKRRDLGNFEAAFRMCIKKQLEINPDHRIITHLRRRVQLENKSDYVKDLVLLLFETQMLSSTCAVEYPEAHAARIHKLITLGIGGSDPALGIPSVESSDSDSCAMEVD